MCRKRNESIPKQRKQAQQRQILFFCPMTREAKEEEEEEEGWGKRWLQRRSLAGGV